jgi:hypothetical protein
VLRIIFLIVLATGGIYVSLYFMDIALGGIADIFRDMRDGARRIAAWRARRPPRR